MQLKKRLSLYKDPKHIAWATWTILANNPLNKTSFLVLKFIEAIVVMAYTLILFERLHFSNVQQLPSQEAALSMASQGLSLKFMQSLDDTLQSLMTDSQRQIWLILTCCLLGIVIFLPVTLLLMAIFIKNHENLHKPSFLKKIYCFIVVAFMTVLQLPAFDVMLRCFMTIKFETSTSVLILEYTVTTLALVLFTVIMVFIARLFNICMPTDLVPWCQPVSKIIYLNVLFRAALVACVVIDGSGLYTLIEVICLFTVQGALAIYRLLFSPQYDAGADFAQKTQDFLVLTTLFFAIVCKAVADTRNYDLIYIICLAPLSTLGWKMFERHRSRQIIQKMKQGRIKLEIEYQFILYSMMLLVQESAKENLESQRIFGQLTDLLVQRHIEDCDDPLCICDEMENFYELMRFKNINNSEVISLLRNERKRYKKIIDDQGLIGTVSNISDLTIKTHQSSESTVQHGQGDQDRLSKKDQANDDHRHEDKSHAQKRSKRTYKINIDEVKFRFVSELIYLFFFEIKQKFPDSFKVQLLSNYYALKFKKMEMLCIFQLRTFERHKLSKLDQITFTTNELFLLHEIEKSQRLKSIEDGKQDHTINGEYFIKINQLYKEFNLHIEALSSSVITFWRELEKDTSRASINVDVLQAKGSEISKNIVGTFRCFQELDDIKLFKDYQMYFQFAIVQLHIQNDQAAFDLYVGKLKSILEINKMFERNFQSEGQNSDYANFIIVDANGQRFGQILQINNTLRQLLGWKEKEYASKRIESFMPTLIRQKHHAFLERYNKTGQSFIINNRTCMFVKKANGFVIPVELLIKFHYSIDHEYVFLAILNPMYEMAPFASGVKLNISQLIFVLTDDEEGRMFECSESCKTLLKINQKFEHEDGPQKMIGDFIADFNYSEFKKGRQQRYFDNDIYEDDHVLDLSYLSDISSIKLGYGLQRVNDALLERQQVRAKVRIFEERYSGGILDMNIFCFQIINDADNLSIARSSVLNSGSIELSNMKNVIQEEAKKNQSLNIKESQNESDSSFSGSGKSSTTSLAEFRNFHSFSNQATPRSLKIIMQLLVLLYVIMMAVASVNLGINVSRQQQSKSDVSVIQLANQLMNYFSMNVLFSRVLLNIANGYEFQSSVLMHNRFASYKQFQVEGINGLKAVQTQLQTTGFQPNQALSDLINGNYLQLYFLDEQDQKYSKMQNVEVGFNLFIERISTFNNLPETQLVGNLFIQNLNGVKPGMNYTPSSTEQLIYFDIENGVLGIRQEVQELIALYSQSAQEHAQGNISSTKVTAIVSVVCIVIVGFIVAPFLTNAEMRKFRAILYFLKIPNDVLPQMIKNCEYCLDMSNEKRYIEIEHDYEKFLGLKISNQQVYQLRQANDEEVNRSNQQKSSGFTGTETYDDNIGSQYDQRTEDNGSLVSGKRSQATIGSRRKGLTQQHSMVKQASEIKEENEEDDEDNDEENIGEEQQKEDKSFNKKLRIENLARMSKKRQERIKVQQAEERAKQQKALELMLQQLKNREVSDSNERELKQQIEAEQKRVKQEQKKESQEYKSKQQKKAQIKQRAYRRRTYIMFLIVSTILLLSTYFIIAYFLAMQTFNTAYAVVGDLQLIFQRGSCFDNTMNFVREDLIRTNNIRLAQYNNQSAADYYLNFCLEKEQAYAQLKVNLPPYLQSVKPFIDVLDSSNMCQSVYVNQYAYLQKLCFQAVDGILSQGLSNAFYYMFTQLQNQILVIDRIDGVLDIPLQSQMMQDPLMIQIIDTKAMILNPALNELKSKCYDAVVNYIQGLLNNFIIAFVIFAIVLSLCSVILLFLGFKSLRKIMWDTNIILKIIPFEAISRKNQMKIKEFFIS